MLGAGAQLATAPGYVSDLRVFNLLPLPSPSPPSHIPYILHSPVLCYMQFHRLRVYSYYLIARSIGIMTVVKTAQQTSHQIVFKGESGAHTSSFFRILKLAAAPTAVWTRGPEAWVST